MMNREPVEFEVIKYYCSIVLYIIQTTTTLLKGSKYGLIYIFIYDIYPLNANRLSDTELPLPLKAVQVPELCCVQGCADGIAT